ncbi:MULTISPECIES: DUF4864 domain-containing protein [unclassified Marinovum]
MFRFVMVACAVVLMAFPALGQEAQPKNPDIEAVIGNQLDAFEANDVARAFTFASPTIKGIFGTAENFGVMVQRGYPMVMAPGAVTYLDLADIGGDLWQRVEIIDQAGKRHYLGYKMEAGDGGWTIGGVQFLPAPDVAV